MPTYSFSGDFSFSFISILFKAPQRISQLLDGIMDLQAYLLALRPLSYSQSLFPSLLGCCLAYGDVMKVDLPAVFLTLLVVTSVHSAGNLVNTYEDYMRGIDSSDTSDDRTLVDRRLSAETVQYMGTGFYFTGLVLFGCLCAVSRTSPTLLAFMFFGGLSGSFLYTREPAALKYIGYGDLVVVITFGPLTTLFSYLAVGGTLIVSRWVQVVVLALPMAFITEAILHSNNTRDMSQDESRQVATLALYLGHGYSYLLYCFLIFLPFAFLTVLGAWFSAAFAIPFLTIFMAFNLEKSFRFGRLTSLPRQTGKFGLFFNILYVPVFLYVNI